MAAEVCPVGTLPLGQVDSTVSLLANTPVIWGHLLALRVSEPPSSIIYGSEMGHESHGTDWEFQLPASPRAGGGMLGLQEMPFILVTQSLCITSLG